MQEAFGAMQEAFEAMQEAFGAMQKAFGAQQEAFGAKQEAFGKTRMVLVYHEASDGPGPRAPGARRPTYGPLWDPWHLNICFLGPLWTLWDPWPFID